MKKKVGLLVGQERSFPDALIKSVNSRGTGVTAEYITVGAVTVVQPNEYRVILDRISHEVTFYQPYLKNAVLSGTHVINNPFWRIADDKFFGTSLVSKLGIPCPKTVVLPSKDYPPDVTSESLRNLSYPLNWETVVDHTGLPAILKPYWGGGWKHIYRVNTVEELISRYDRTGSLCMILQEYVEWEQYIRCLCVGKDTILPTAWDPRKPHFERYRTDYPPLDSDVNDHVIRNAVLINQALGYDMNTVEFAIRDGVPYAIDFMNSAPDFDMSSLGPTYFNWVVEAMADLVISRASENHQSAPVYRWDEFLR